MIPRCIGTSIWTFAITANCLSGLALGADLPEIKQQGVLRHLGVPYANFVTGTGDGMDVELIKRFAEHLGVRYEYVETTWANVIGDLSGKSVEPRGNTVKVRHPVPVRGDIIANGFTILPWRQKVVDYSTPIFPTQVWLIARADSPAKPIQPTGQTQPDIAATKAVLKGRTVLGKAKTCLDPSLYALAEVGAIVKLFGGGINELAPAVINREAEFTILDVPDALVALEKWPGQIKVIGPMSPVQEMGCAFAKTAPQLRQAFNRFLEQCAKDGTYLRLLKKYYPAILNLYPAFFQNKIPAKQRPTSNRRSNRQGTE